MNTDPDLQALKKRLEIVEQELLAIKSRNDTVTLNKAWETSITRTALIASITFLTSALVFRLLEVPNYLSSAIIPTCGYCLSTLSLPLCRRLWSSRKADVS